MAIDKRVSVFGKNLFGEPMKDGKRGALVELFEAAPFSVLSARDGWWMRRNRAWKNRGITGELLIEGVQRKMDAAKEWQQRKKKPAYIGCPIDKYSKKRATETANSSGPKPAFGHLGDMDMYRRKEGTRKEDPDEEQRRVTSMFDPTLTELMYRWFCPPEGQIVDPFAGGDVRGVVAGYLGYKYWGCDLREDQIDSNRKQGAKICPHNLPIWVCGDSTKELTHAPRADFIFSCPPYGDLEVYSDAESDLSNMNYSRFIPALEKIVKEASKRLLPNRFACFVVGDFRDKKTGLLNNFVSDTIQCFSNNGLSLYNEMILVTAVGSLPIRAKRLFEKTRKIGKSHQNILVFVKGDSKQAAFACNRIKGKT